MYRDKLGIVLGHIMFVTHTSSPSTIWPQIPIPPLTKPYSMGPIQVPADRYWGAQTQRSLKYFNIGHDTMPREVIQVSRLDETLPPSLRQYMTAQFF